MGFLIKTALVGACVFACLALVCVPTCAQSTATFSSIEAKENACEVARQTVDGSAVCEQEAQVAADRRLNTVYAQILGKLKQAHDDPYQGEIVRRLVAAQRAWMSFRDAECTYESSVAIHAPLEGFEYQACRYKQTKARVLALEDVGMPQNAR